MGGRGGHRLGTTGEPGTEVAWGTGDSEVSPGLVTQVRGEDPVLLEEQGKCQVAPRVQRTA